MTQLQYFWQQLSNLAGSLLASLNGRNMLDILIVAMRTGIAIVTLLACLVGLPLVAWGGWECIIVGAACVLFCFLYTTLFSRIAMGDVLVVLFFGIIPVGYTFYLQSPHSSIMHIPAGVWLLAVAQGLMTECLLLVNNFRDRHTDAAAGKTTLVTIIGSKATLVLFHAVGFVSILLAMRGTYCLTEQHSLHHSLLAVILLPYHFRAGAVLSRIHSGKKLNIVLGMMAKSILLFAILVSLNLLLG